MVRVLHLIGTLEKAGGAQRILLEVLRRVDRARFAPEVAVLHGASELNAELAAIGVPVHDLRASRGLRGPAEAPSLRSRWKGLLDPIGICATRRLVRERGITVLHCHLSRAEIVGGLAARRLPGVRLLLHKHNDDAWWTRPHLALIHRMIVRRADRIVAVSDAVGEHFARLDPAVRPKLVRVYNGVDLAALDAARGNRAATRSSLGIAADAPLVVAVGRLVPQKGFDLLVRAMALPPLAKATALVVGRGEESARLEALARELGVDARVRFPGVRADVPALFAAADVAAAPSRWEGFGIAAAEAMAVGTPVVAARVSALPEVVADGETGRLVPPEDPAALAEALAAMLAAPNRAGIGAKARARVEEKFTIGKTVDAWQSLWS